MGGLQALQGAGAVELRRPDAGRQWSTGWAAQGPCRLKSRGEGEARAVIPNRSVWAAAALAGVGGTGTETASRDNLLTAAELMRASM